MSVQTPKKTSYEERCQKIGRILDQKAKSYGNSFTDSTKILELLFPYGIATARYGDLLAVLRIIEKLYRVVHSPKEEEESPFLDIAGYALLMLANKRD